MVKKFSTRIGLDIFQVIKRGPALLFSDGIQQASGVAVTLMIARLSAKETLGEFQLALSVLAIAAVISIRGFDTVVLRDAARNKDGVYRRAVRTRFYWSLLGVPVMALFSLFYYYTNEASLAWAFLAIALLVPWYFVVQSWQFMYKGKELFTEYAISSIARSVLTVLATILILLTAGDNVAALLLVYVGTNIFVNGITFVKSFAVLRNDEVSSDWKEYSYFLSKAGLFKQMAGNADKVLAGIVFSPSVLAIYAVAVIIPNAVMLSFKSIFTMALPKLSQRDFLGWRDLFIALMIGVIATAVTASMVWFLLIPLFGEQYRSALPMAMVASTSLLFLPLSQLLVNFSFMQSKRKAVMVNELLSPALKMLFIVILGSIWQIMGFAIVFALVPLIWTIIALMTLKIDFKKMVVV
jgi:O-antigen/teichoic acid export membrane protein